MTREAVHVRENHAPGDIGRAPPQLGVYEITDPAGAQTQRYQRRNEIRYGQPRQFIFSGQQRHCGYYAEKAAVKGHSALPNRKDLQRML